MALEQKAKLIMMMTNQILVDYIIIIINFVDKESTLIEEYILPIIKL